jgi:hypothetical protein
METLAREVGEVRKESCALTGSHARKFAREVAAEEAVSWAAAL